METKQFELKWVKDLQEVGPAENPAARLIGTVEILGASFHVNLEQVHDIHDPTTPDDQRGNDTKNLQTTVIDENDTYAPNIWELAQGSCETVKVDGRDYLLLISPFQR